MKSISKIGLALSLLLSFTASYGQIKNTRTETVTIYGTCGMCEKTIEKAGNLKKVAIVDWNKDTKKATITYDSTKTNPSEILKRIALAGYDSESFLAPEDVYAKLPDCCRYERNPLAAKGGMKMAEESKMKTGDTDHSVQVMASQDTNQMKAVLDNYFGLKDALIQTDASKASEKSKGLVTAIKSVKMDQLPMDVHLVWMKVLKSLEEDATAISNSKDITQQRNRFLNLSKNMYELMKVSKYERPVYYQHCPMYNDGKGANWLSKENAIKNPYFGTQMLTCGKTVETIK